MTSTISHTKRPTSILAPLQLPPIARALARPIRILLVGRTGVGKSSTVNALVGKDVAPVGDYEPTTMEVKEYVARVEGVAVEVLDTPGLCDDLGEVGNDGRYLELIREGVRSVDLVLFVSRFDETRVTADEKRAIRLLGDAFGADLWKRAVVVFTFAGSSVPPGQTFASHCAHRARVVRGAIAAHAGASVAEAIPVVPVDNRARLLPDGTPWLGALWSEAFTRLEPSAGFAYLLATGRRIHSGEVALTTEQKRRVDGKIVLAAAVIGAELGFAVGGPPGAIVGAVLTALFSFLFA